MFASFFIALLGNYLGNGLVGTQMKGDVVRVQVDFNDYINPKTGEIIKLQYSYSYQPEIST